MNDWFSGVRAADLIRRIRSRRRHVSTEDIEDAIQDVYLRALERARSHDPPSEPVNADAYFLRSVENRLVSRGRATWRETASDDPASHSAGGDESTPEHLTEARERAVLFGLLAAAIEERDLPLADGRLGKVFAGVQARLADALTPKHWILIRMRVLENIGYVECARQLGVSVGTAHKWANIALATLRDALYSAGIEAGALDYEPPSRDPS